MGGILKISAMVMDLDGDVQEVRIFYSGIYTGLSLYDDGVDGDLIPFDGIFSRSYNIPSGVPKNQYLFSLIALDSSGFESHPWPYFKVKEE